MIYHLQSKRDVMPVIKLNLQGQNGTLFCGLVFHYCLSLFDMDVLRRNGQSDEAIAKLAEMGFSVETASQALRTQGDVCSALNALLTNPERFCSTV